MKYYPTSPLLYEKGFSIIINDEALSFDSSICYYFDYDQRSHSVNMDFPHFHSFYELMILLSPKAYHFVNGTRYDLASNDIVLLAPSVLHQSEYPPGTPPRAGLFPQRNRIISGLSDLILVIEAREKSGTLITVDMALEQGKEVRAVPGRITDELSRGCNRLIWQGAAPALSPEQLLEELFPLSGSGRQTGAPDREGQAQAARAKAAAGGRKEGPSPEEQNGGLREAILRRLEPVPVSPEYLLRELEKEGMSCALPQLMQLLMELTLEGRCMQEGTRFCRRPQV